MVNRAAVISLAKGGTRPKAIARQLSCHPNTVYECIRAARKRGENIPPFGKGVLPETPQPEAPSVRQIVVPVRLFSLLEKHAERKGVSITEAARRLLEDALLGGVTPNG